MLNFQPLKVVIIDFNRALRVENTREGTVMGTPGYYPEREDWKDGDYQWDVWALAAIILECDMERDAYFSTKCEKDGKQRIKKYLDIKGIQQKMRQMAESIIMKPNLRAHINIDQIEEYLKYINFRKLAHDT